MLSQSIGKHDAYIADLMLRVTAMEVRQETSDSEKIDELKSAVAKQVAMDANKSLKALTGRLNVFDAVLSDAIKVQRDLVRDVKALQAADHQVQMSRDIVDLQQMIAILKRNRARGTFPPSTNRPSRLPNDNVSLIDFKNASPGDKDDSLIVAARVSELEKSFEVLNLMHRNLRTELAHMNLVDP